LEEKGVALLVEFLKRFDHCRYIQGGYEGRSWNLSGRKLFGKGVGFTKSSLKRQVLAEDVDVVDQISDDWKKLIASAGWHQQFICSRNFSLMFEVCSRLLSEKRNLEGSL
jgi:hypothetical protein